MKLKELFETPERSILSVMGKQEDQYPGYFSCAGNKLTSLQGAPSAVKGDFYCHSNNLTSLQGAPSVVKGNFVCAGNNLTSLEGAPSVVNGDFSCYNNNLTSLAGAPSVVKGGFYCFHNKLTSLAGIHKIIKEIHGAADFSSNPIKSNVLGLMRIKGLMKMYLDNEQVQNILNKYLAGDRDIIKCQSELQDAGLEEFAKL
jgi:hypothetical protein